MIMMMRRSRRTTARTDEDKDCFDDEDKEEGMDVCIVFIRH